MDIPVPILKSPLDIPVPVLKSPIILLERCDKIWETLQLIKTIQNKDPLVVDDDEGEKKKEVLYSNKAVPTSSRIRNQSTLRSGNAISLPFQFSIQRTKKLFPCLTCGKQYMEKRSLRRHSERVHRIIIPLQRNYTRRRKNSNSKPIEKKEYNKDSPVTLRSKENCNSEEFCSNKNLYGRTTMPESQTTTKLSTVNISKRLRSATHDISFTNDQKRERIETRSSSPAKLTLARCTLCRQKVMSVRKHLIHYHKIGCSSSMMKQLESSLLIDNETPEDNKTALKDTMKETQDRVRKDESKVQETPQVRKKRKYTFSYMNTKRRQKLNGERCTSVQNMLADTQSQDSSSETTYKCDICLGIYASYNSYTKHRRIHRIRGENKHNFHKFKCRYFNSPLNKHNRIGFTVKSTDSVTENTNDDMNRDLRLSDSKHKTVLLNKNGKTSKIGRATMYNGKMNKNDTTCLCGRTFRNPYTLFVHKKNCNLSNQEDQMMQRVTRDKYSSDRDSGIGINITIKKRNNSYEIVGKDSDEDKQNNIPELNEGASSSNAFDHTTKDSTNTHTEQLNTSESSEYSKDHSVLKLQVADEDMIIDIEDDIISGKNNVVKQTIKRENDGKNKEVKQTFKKDSENYSKERQNNDTKNMKNEGASDESSMLKQIHQDVFNKLAIKQKSENATIRQGNKMNLQSSQRSRNVNRDHNYSCKDMEVCMTEFDPFSKCRYCNKQLGSSNSYYNHQCTVKEGKPLDRFSLNLLCFCCNDVLNNCNEFDEHMRGKHFDRAFYCYLCPSRFESEKERNRHSRVEHNMSCRFCQKKLAISVKALHEAYHLGFGYPCHQCKKAYASKRNLSYHKSTIHKNEVNNTVICNICLKPVKLKSFRRHMYAHDRNECHFCGKIFTDRTGMEYHTLVYHRSGHSKIKCNDCGIRFLTKKQLANHKNECDGGTKGVKKRATA